MYALTQGTVFTGYQVLHNHSVIIDQGKIVDICPDNDIPHSMTSIDIKGANLSPGFIDLQLNGCGGVMFNDDISPNTLDIMHNCNLQSGCTSFLPTLITSSDEDIKKAIEAQKTYQSLYPNQSLGLHLEGPYINMVKKGIHNFRYIRQPNQEILNFISANSPYITKITLAPELADSRQIKQLVDSGIIVSAGHSNATFEQARAGFDAGIRFTTHLFNAMTTIAGREPGLVGATYDHCNVYAGIIADGHHVHYSNIALSKRLKGEKLVLVTNATAAAGSEIEEFSFVGNKVYVKNGKCVDEQGTLGGSALTMIDAVKNVVTHVGIELDEALRMATLYPARAINLDGKLGIIDKGMVANLTVFDSNFSVLATVVNGEYKQKQ